MIKSLFAYHNFKRALRQKSLRRFENQFIMLTISGKETPGSPIWFVQNLSAGEHGCIFFTTRENMYTIQFAFVKSGLEENWGVVYASATESVEEVKNAMKSYGLDAQKHVEDGDLVIIRGEDLYKDPKNPDLKAWTSATKSVCDNFIAQGKKGVRVAADLSSYFISRSLEKQWFDLEYALETKFSIPLTVLCAYDAVQIPGLKDMNIISYYKQINKDKKELVDAHSFAIYATKDKSMVFSI